MYTLSFIVNRNRMVLNREESDNIPIDVSGSVTVYFDLSSEWKDNEVSVLFDNFSGECPTQVIMEDSYCTVPFEALRGYWFRLQLSKETNGVLLKTNKVTIMKNI